MNWDRIEGYWKQFKGTAIQQWGRLTDDRLGQVSGQRDRLAGEIQEAYGITRDQAGKQSGFETRHGKRVQAHRPIP